MNWDQLVLLCHPYMFDAHDARSCRTVHSRPASENPKCTKIQQIETSLMQICEATVSSGHNISNPISAEEIALPLFSSPAAEAKQMSPSGSGINNPLDCGYCFASGGACLRLIARPGLIGKNNTVAGTRPFPCKR